MSYDPVAQLYTLHVRGIDYRVVELMRIAAMRLRMTQGEAVETALRVWLSSLPLGADSRFSDLDKELAHLVA